MRAQAHFLVVASGCSLEHFVSFVSFSNRGFPVIPPPPILLYFFILALFPCKKEEFLLSGKNGKVNEGGKNGGWLFA